jgi:hypothetical protein
MGDGVDGPKLSPLIVLIEKNFLMLLVRTKVCL